MIYLDNAATTPMNMQVCDAMLPYMLGNYGNPSGVYKLAEISRKAVEKARNSIAETINAKPDEIIFTSGGTESDNWVLNNASLKYGKHIIVSAIEHHAILNTCEYLKKNGTDIDYLGVNENGIIKVDELEKMIRDDTGLISIMLVNNEIGTIQPLKNVCEIAHRHNIRVHTDAVAAFGHIRIDVNELGVDYLSASAHKFNGPKGCGFIFAKDRLITPFMNGGMQEYGMRAGTENVAGIAGMEKAAILSNRTIDGRTYQEKIISDYMIKRILTEIPDSRLNGDRKMRVSGNMNFSFQYVDGGMLVVMLDKQGICASAGSACTSASKEPSHVLKALGLPDELANGSIRFTIDDRLTHAEADYVIDCLKKDVKKLRALM